MLLRLRESNPETGLKGNNLHKIELLSKYNSQLPQKKMKHNDTYYFIECTQSVTLY